MKGIEPDDDLMRPTLQRFEPPGGGGGPRPWTLWMQCYLGILGGPTAATIAAWINSGRLDMPWMRRIAILGAGFAATIVGIAIVTHPALATGPGRRTDLALAWRAYGAVIFGLFFVMQKSADRLYQVNSRPVPLYTRPLWDVIRILFLAILLNLLLMNLATELWRSAA